MVILGKEPIIVDTGAPIHTQSWFRQVSSLVDPQDIRWIYLSHDDGDHTGSLHRLLELAPNATLVVNFFITERLALEQALPLDRMIWLGPDDDLDAGDRRLHLIVPPIFDGPTTRALYDESTSVLWAVDSFAALAPGPCSTSPTCHATSTTKPSRSSAAGSPSGRTATARDRPRTSVRRPARPRARLTRPRGGPIARRRHRREVGPMLEEPSPAPAHLEARRRPGLVTSSRSLTASPVAAHLSLEVSGRLTYRGETDLAGLITATARQVADPRVRPGRHCASPAELLSAAGVPASGG
jgi:hypothetical protein